MAENFYRHYRLACVYCGTAEGQTPLIGHGPVLFCGAECQAGYELKLGSRYDVCSPRPIPRRDRGRQGEGPQ